MSTIDEVKRNRITTTRIQKMDTSEIVDEIHAKEDAIAAKDTEIERLRGHLIHIGEYWNGSETDGAMSDALAEIKATVAVALETTN